MAGWPPRARSLVGISYAEQGVVGGGKGAEIVPFLVCQPIVITLEEETILR